MTIISWSHKLISFYQYIFIVICCIRLCSALIKTNKMRYSTIDTTNNFPISQLELSFTSSPARDSRYEKMKLYSTNQNLRRYGFPLLLLPESEDKQSDHWTFDPGDDVLGNILNNAQAQTSQQEHQADYSPTLRLLTSYDPVGDKEVLKETGSKKAVNDGRIVGSTLYGHVKGSMPSVRSKLASSAIRLHDEMLKEPPKDGNMRVRMYHHRAIHDDIRLYGNGPWKYWGHGWGLEFGYDPRSSQKDKDFYQKGYTIERAFGRDFCKDKKNCRQSDPNFFKDPLKVGQYSEEVVGLKAKNTDIIE